ncbi:hypothetical protein VPH35_036883 [Triticum aestivum]
MSSSSLGYIAIPRCPVIFDGANYTEFAAFMRIHMRGLRLLGVLSGEVPCPQRPVPPMAPIPPPPPPALATASDDDRAAARVAADDLVAAYDQQVMVYSDALSVYRDDLAGYTQWCDDDVRAAAVLTSSVLPQFAYEFMGLGTVFEMWTHLRQRYQPSRDALYLSVVRQEHALQQGDSTIDEFYTQSSAIWRQLDSLRTPVCGTCACCQIVRSGLEFQRVYEFLSRLRGEFEPRRAQLFARGCVPISEALSELRAEETRSVVLGCFRFPLCLLLQLLPQCVLAPVLRRYCPLMVVTAVLVRVALVLVLIVATATGMVTLRLSAFRRNVICVIGSAILLLGQVLLPRHRLLSPSLSRKL